MNSLKTLITKLNPPCRQALQQAVSLCLKRGHFDVELAHWLKCLIELCQEEFTTINQQSKIQSNILIEDIEKQLSEFKQGNDATPAISPRVIELINQAWLMASLEYQSRMISLPMLLYVLIDNTTLKQLAFSISGEFEKLDPNLLRNIITTAPAPQADNTTVPPPEQSALKQYTTNLNIQAKTGKIDAAIGRENEIRQVIDILARRRQNNAILTGEPGVGKTAIVEGLALLIEQGDVPDSLKNVTVHALDLGLLQAGAGIKGEFENRLKALIKEIKSATDPIILFIDEAHTLIGSGGTAGQNDAANLLKPALARGELRSIAATTWDEYKKYFEKDPALTRRFQMVKVQEPDNDTAIRMLRSLMHSLEQHHHITIDDEAIKQAVILSDRYIHGRLLPDKAISVLDTACARVAGRLTTTPPEIETLDKLITQLKLEQSQYERECKRGKNHKSALKAVVKRLGLQEKKLQKLKAQWQQEKIIIEDILKLYTHCTKHPDTQMIKAIKQHHKKLALLQKGHPMIWPSVNQQVIAEVISDWTGIPVGNVAQSEADKLLNLNTLLQRDVIGQDAGLTIICQAIKAASANLASPDKPYGVFLLVGPSGVGKTQTALSLAENVYGSRNNITTINMSEFKEEHKVSMLAGSPPGYVGYGEGGVLTEAVRRQPYSLILLDEMEKAHPGIQDVFYQVFDRGIIKDGQGRDVNFKNTIIIMTSNACSDLISSLCEDSAQRPDFESLVKAIEDELLKTFKPAFLGRVTVVPYMPLTPHDLNDIVMMQLHKIQQRLTQEYGIRLDIDSSLVNHIL